MRQYHVRSKLFIYLLISAQFFFTFVQYLLPMLGERKKANELYDELITHPRIRYASETLFKQGKYRNAILDAYIAIEEMVREKSRDRRSYGVNLMCKVFNEKKPILKWRSVNEEVEKNELKGYKNIIVGALQGIRNPKAHAIFEQRPMRALQLLNLACLLAELIDVSEYVGAN